MKLLVQEIMSQGMTDPSIIAANTMLFCTKCYTDKPEAAFSFRGIVKSQRQPWCKSCKAKWRAGKRPKAKRVKPQVTMVFGVRV
jgi:hypothetical protein